MPNACRPCASRWNRSSERAAAPVAEVLDVDREYREKAANDELRRIAPRRFTDPCTGR
jgi:hypothetical protein